MDELLKPLSELIDQFKVVTPKYRENLTLLLEALDTQVEINRNLREVIVEKDKKIAAQLAWIDQAREHFRHARRQLD